MKREGAEYLYRLADDVAGSAHRLLFYIGGAQQMDLTDKERNEHAIAARRERKKLDKELDAFHTCLSDAIAVLDGEDT